jgi:hypothetical protein
MDTKTSDPYDIDSDGTIVGIAVGLGIVTFAIFPLLIPGLIVLAIFAVPLLALPLVVALPIALLASPILAVRAFRRRRRRRAADRSGARGAIAPAARHQAS